MQPTRRLDAEHMGRVNPANAYPDYVVPRSAFKALSLMWLTTFARAWPPATPISSTSLVVCGVSMGLARLASGQELLPDGWTAGNEFRLGEFVPGIQRSPSVAAVTIGWVAVWQSEAQDSDGSDAVYGQMFDHAGRNTTGEFRINTYVPCLQGAPRVAALPGGGFLVVWKSACQDPDGSQGIYGQVFDETGARVGAEVAVNHFWEDLQETVMISSYSEGAIISWASRIQDAGGWGIYAQLVGPRGELTGPEFQVNTNRTTTFHRPRAAGTDFGFVVVWQSSLDVAIGAFGQRFDLRGNKIGNEFQINTYSPGGQQGLSVAALSGEFLVSWQSTEQDPDGSQGIYGQLHWNNGTRKGTEFRINTSITDLQSGAEVVGMPGGFLSAWQSVGQGLGGSTSVYGQMLDVDANPVGPEFRLNEASVFNQSGVDVAVLSSGFATVWTSYGQDSDGSSGIYGRIFTNQAWQSSATTPHTTAGPFSTLAQQTSPTFGSTTGPSEGNSTQQSMSRRTEDPAEDGNPSGSREGSIAGGIAGGFIVGAIGGALAMRYAIGRRCAASHEAAPGLSMSSVGGAYTKAPGQGTSDHATYDRVNWPAAAEPDYDTLQV